MKKIIWLICFISALTVHAQQPVQPPKLTVAERNTVIDTLIAKINALYVYEDLAKK